MPMPKGLELDPKLGELSDAKLDRILAKAFRSMPTRWGKAVIRMTTGDESPERILIDLGYSKTRCRENLWRMRQDSRFQECQQVLLEQYRRRATITADEVRLELWLIAKQAKAEGHFSSAVSALSALNKMCGYNQPTQIESKVLHASVHLDGASEADLQMALDLTHRMIEEKANGTTPKKIESDKK